MRALAALVVLLTLVACGLFEPPTLACTAIGCESAVTILVDEDLQNGVDYAVEVCIDGGCDDVTLSVPDGGGAVGATEGTITLGTEPDSIRYALGEGDWSGVHSVSLTVRDATGGELLVEVDEEVEFERSQPNGPGCPPVCWFAEIRA